MAKQLEPIITETEENLSRRGYVKLDFPNSQYMVKPMDENTLLLYEKQDDKYKFSGRFVRE